MSVATFSHVNSRLLRIRLDCELAEDSLIMLIRSMKGIGMNKSVFASIAEVQAAARTGRLASYQSVTKTDESVRRSWGPAMRR